MRLDFLSVKIWLSVFLIFIVLSAIPRLAIYARRLHDLNHSAHWLWLILLVFVPFLAYVLLPGLLYLLIVKGTDGANRFGNAPIERQNQIEIDDEQSQ
jgi:uncharacterized membrane protein YhaH (DUF805 family)